MNQVQAVALNDGLHCKKKLWRKHGQLPQISVLPVRHPDLRKVILPHQLQNMLRVLAIRLLLPPPLRADLPRGMPLKLANRRRTTSRGRRLNENFQRHT
jgi:hypothetical protein